MNIKDLAPTLGQPVPDTETLPDSNAAQNPDQAPQQAASGRDKHASSTDERLLPDADLQINRVRGMDADVTLHRRAVTAPKVPTREVDLHLKLNNALLTIDPLDFVLEQGRFLGRVEIDARKDVPQSAIDMRIEDIDLSQFKTAPMKAPPLAGSMAGRFKIQGSGGSIHKLASTADGAVSVVIPHGEINDAIAELTGINLTRGLGLLLAKNETRTSIRCSVVDFQARNGTLDAKTLFVDTTDVLIIGRGNVNLRSEALNLSVEGNSKKIRFTRLRSPITLKGTLSHPAVGLDVGKLSKQAAVATALGVLLTPVAAVIAFFDPGLAKNKDCVQLLSDADNPFQN